MPLVRLEPSTARRSTLARELEVTQRPVEPDARTLAASLRVAPVSPPASSASDVVSLIDSEPPKSDSTIQ